MLKLNAFSSLVDGEARQNANVKCQLNIFNSVN